MCSSISNPHRVSISSIPLGTTERGFYSVLIHIYRHYENDSKEEFDFHTVEACLAGLGTGLLTTAAVSLSPTLADLPLAGAEVVRVAFRLGVLVDEVSQNLQPRQASTEAGPGDSWAYVVPDVAVDEVQKELDAIHMTEVRLNPTLLRIQ